MRSNPGGNSYKTFYAVIYNGEQKARVFDFNKYLFVS